MERTIRRGDIYYAELNPVVGSEQGGTRPVLIISNDIGNSHSLTVIIAAITGKTKTKAKLPTHTEVKNFPIEILSTSHWRMSTDDGWGVGSGLIISMR